MYMYRIIIIKQKMGDYIHKMEDNQPISDGMIYMVSEIQTKTFECQLDV